MNDQEPVKTRGEVEISINGELKRIRFSLRAQARIVEALGLDSVEKIPELMRKMDSQILAELIHCSLMPGDEMSLDDVLDAHLPMYATMDAVIKAINLATWGTEDGRPFDRNPLEEKETESPGASLRH